jgi:flagellar motor switch protein FliN/FliY
VSATRVAAQDWLFSEFMSLFGTAFETMTGERPPVERVEHAEGVDPAIPGSLRWRQPFSRVPGAIWVVASETDWAAAGGSVLRAAGLPEDDPSKSKSEYLEILNQTFAGIAKAMAERLAREVVSQGREDSGATAPEIVWAAVRAQIGGTAANYLVGIETALLDEFIKNATREPEAAPERASTFDLLFDVELPVSVSFGRAQVALKDVLKLTTGSIVELNRAISDPVEVIVNNCVIARGEVVVVEGNFGVRIQQVISRQERLRTLT